MTKDDALPSVKFGKLKKPEDYVQWKRRINYTIMEKDHKLLGLTPAPPIDAERTQWIARSARAKSAIVLHLGDSAMAKIGTLIDDHTSSAHDLWIALEKIYTETNSQAVQNLMHKLDTHIFSEGGNWDKHVSKFLEITGQLSTVDAPLTKLSQRCRPKYRDAPTLTIPTRPQPLRRTSRTTVTMRGGGEGVILDALAILAVGTEGRPQGIAKRKGNCHYCGIRGHFQAECRKRLADQRSDQQPRRRLSRFGNRSQQQSNGELASAWNAPQGDWQQGQANLLQQIAANVAALQIGNQPKGEPPHGNNAPPQYRGFMAKVKFKSDIACLSRAKTNEAYIDSGATHNFFYSRSFFLTYELMSSETVKAAVGSTILVAKGTVKLPVCGGTIVEAYHAPSFASHIISVGSLLKSFDVHFSESLRSFPACFLMRKGTFDVLWETAKKDGLFPIAMGNTDESPKHTIALTSKRPSPSDLVKEWHGRTGHTSIDRYIALSDTCDDVPHFDRHLLEKFQCIPCITAKARRAPIHRSTYKASRPLEHISLDISGPVAPSLAGSILTVVFLDSFTAKSDVFTIKSKAVLPDILERYKARA